MANGDKVIGYAVASGEVTATGQPIFIPIGFKPSEVTVYNITNNSSLVWVPSLPLDAGFKYLTAPGGIAYTPAGTVTQPTFTADATAFSYITQAYDGLKGASIHTSQNPNADGAEKVNAAAVAGYTTVAAGAWTVGALTSPEVPRGVMISIQNDSGGPLNLFEGTMTFTVTGTSWNGTVITNLISFVSTAGNKSVANGQFRSSYGSGLPFKTVTNVTVDNVPDNGLKISVGLGTRIQLLSCLSTMAVADVLRATVNDTAQTIAGNLQSFGGGIYSFVYPTFADNDRIKATYKSPTGATGVVSQPTFNGTPATITPGGDQAYITVGGISPSTSGFTIGTDVNINAVGDTLKWIAYR